MHKVILVIDDELAMSSFIATLLQQSGYETLVAHNGHQALQLLKRRPAPDLIITDYLMPRITGSQLIEKLAQLPGLCHIPVLMVTGTDPQSLVWPKEGRLSAVLHKPFNNQDLLQWIERSLP